MKVKVETNPWTSWQPTVSTALLGLLLTRMEAEFGMTPSARTRIDVKEPMEYDSLLDFHPYLQLPHVLISPDWRRTMTVARLQFCSVIRPLYHFVNQPTGGEWELASSSGSK
jgi:hypothetical protein